MRVETNVYRTLSYITQSLVTLSCVTHSLVTVLFSLCFNLQLEGASGSCNAKVNPLDIKVRQESSENVIYHSNTRELFRKWRVLCDSWVSILFVSIEHWGPCSITVYNWGNPAKRVYLRVWISNAISSSFAQFSSFQPYWLDLYHTN